MTIKLLGGIAVALWLIGQSGWILFFRPNPPIGAQIATRKSRTAIAAGSLVFGLAYLALLIFA